MIAAFWNLENNNQIWGNGYYDCRRL